MISQSLLKVDTDKLFQQLNVEEIEDVRKKLNNEIERKREELRMMVGERYRDFIEAADTISQMKLLSVKVIDDMNNMKEKTAELQKRQLSGFRIESQFKATKHHTRACAASLIKILIDLVDYIWDSVDKADFTRATLLFLLARYVKTSLEINASFRINQCFPVVSRQWSFMVQFKDIILHGAEEILKSQHNSQISCSGLLSLALLESLSATQLLERYLSLRSQALQAILSPCQPLDNEIVKQKLSNSYILLVHSILVIHQCFIEHFQAKDGLLWKELQSHISSQSPPTIYLLDTTISEIPTTFLPSDVKNFRLVLGHPLEPVSEDQIRDAVVSWLGWAQQHVQEQGSLLLQQLCSLRNLQGLRDPPTVCEEWPLIAQKLLLLPSVDLWSDMYRSLITVRAQQLVSLHWDSALKTLQEHIKEAYLAATLDTKQTEVDLLWYIWKESTPDLSNVNSLKNTSGLWLKARGITVQVAELCASLEDKICSLLQDLACLCPDQEVDTTLLAISHTLKAHQQALCSDLLSRLVQFVRELSTGTTNESGAMLLAKFLQSVPELCPSLSRCLSANVLWQESHLLLQEECLTSYKVWLEIAKVRILSHVMDTLGTAVPGLHSLPQWEEINIEEEGETGEKLQSVLKVPCSASMNLQSALLFVASVIGHTAIPKQISEKLVDFVLTSIVELFSKCVEKSLTQTQYLQMFLDMKYLYQLYYNDSMSKEFKNLYQKVILQVEAKIDPFDLNVFMPYINNNVKITAFQTQVLLGGSDPQSAVSHRNSEPSVMALSSSTALWFPLLHIAAPRLSSTPSKPKGKKSTKTVISAANMSTETGVKQSSASSFFGAMATDWFG